VSLRFPVLGTATRPGPSFSATIWQFRRTCQSPSTRRCNAETEVQRSCAFEGFMVPVVVAVIAVIAMVIVALRREWPASRLIVERHWPLLPTLAGPLAVNWGPACSSFLVLRACPYFLGARAGREFA